MKEILTKVFSGGELSEKDVIKFLALTKDDKINPEQTGALLGAISARKGGVSADEVSYFAKGLKNLSIKPKLKDDAGLIDVCGTGGDCTGTFNISTAVSFVVAGAGVKTVKHGNRSVSSKCGSADVLEKLGIKIELKEDEVQKALDECNLAFLFAPYYNPVMAKIKAARNAIGIPTIFNLLGPLIHPLNLDYQVVGVYDKSKAELVAKALLKSGLKEAMVIHGADGADELLTTGENLIYHLKKGKINKIILSPEKDLGLKKSELKDLSGGEADFNAKIILDILNGAKGAKRDVVLLNSAAALVVSNKAKDFREAYELAKEIIDTKAALSVLEKSKCF